MDPAPVRSATPTDRNRALVVAWRTLIAGLAWWGLLAALGGELGQLKYFSQVTTLTVALAATAGVIGGLLAIDSPGWQHTLAWCRGASTTYAIVTAVIYQTLLSGNLSATSSLLEHAVVPALAVIDWVVFGPGPAGRRQAWWTALTWLILPICYLGVYTQVRDRTGRPLYPFLDPTAGGRFWLWVGIMLAVFTLVGFAVWAVGRLRSPARSTAPR
jgi:hypothetical protein